MDPLILAIDLGSTHFKVAMFNRALEVLGRGAWRVEYRSNSDGRVEMEVEAAVAGFRAAVAEALRGAGVASDRLAALAVTSQAQTFTILDGQGRTKLPLTSWQDSRAQATCRAMREEPEFVGFAEHASFDALLPGLQLCLLADLHDRQPSLIAAGDCIVPLPSLLIGQLTGGLWTDENLAAMSGLYSLNVRDWWPPALKRCGLAATQLPRICRIGAAPVHTDERAGRLGLRAGLPLVLAGNDQTAGGYGARLHERDAVLLTLGTAQVAYAVSAMPGSPAPGLIAGPYPGGRHYRMVADLYGGNLLDWACRRLPGMETFALFFEAAATSANDNELVFQPDEPEIGGRWSESAASQARPAARAHALLECLVERMAHMLKRLEEDSQKTLLVAGGGSRYPVWPELLSQRLGRPVIPTEGDPLAGAAAMALENLSCIDC